MRKFNPQISSFASFDPNGTKKIFEASESLNTTDGLYKLSASLDLLLKGGKAYTSFNPGSSLIKEGTKIVVQVDSIENDTTFPAFLFLSKVSGDSLKAKHLFKIDAILPETETSKKLENSFIILDPAITIERGGAFPVVALDPTQEDLFQDKEDLNDFQWWAKTKDYVDWLKKEGKDLEDRMSESVEDFEYGGNPENEFVDIEDFFQIGPWVDKEFSDEDFTTESFRHFVLGTSMIGRTFIEDKSGNIYEQTNEGYVYFDHKKFTSEWFYGDVLAKESGKSYNDYWQGLGKECSELIESSYNEYVNSLNEDEAEDKSVEPESKSLLGSTSSFIGGMGAFWLGSKALGALYRGGRKIVKRSLLSQDIKTETVRSINRTYDNLPGVRGKIGRTYAPSANKQAGIGSRVKEIAGAMTRGAAWIGKKETAQKLGQPLLKAVQGSEKASKTIRAARVAAAGRTVAGGTEAAAAVGASAAATGALIVGSMIALQRTYNWMSDKQAPRYGLVEDFAVDHFNPSEIGYGEPITLCWTQEQSAGLGDFMGLSNDSRTTMTMMKIIDTPKHWIFQVLTSQSKEFARLVENPNSMFLVRFEKGLDAKRGVLDNDDISYSSAYIDDISSYAIPTIFQMWALRSDVDDAIGKIGPMVSIFGGAPTEYLFNYKVEEGRVNVKGKIRKVSDIKPEDLGLEADPSLWEKMWKTVTGVFESLNVLRFSNFDRVDEKKSILGWSEYIGEAEGDATKSSFKPYRFASYEVEVSERPNGDGYDIPNNIFFIFDETSLRAKDGEPIACGYYIDGGKTANYQDARRGWVKEGKRGSDEGGEGGEGRGDGGAGKSGEGKEKEKEKSKGEAEEWKQWDSADDSEKGERYSGIIHKERGFVPKDDKTDIAGKSKILKVTDPTNDDIDLWNGSELTDKEKEKFEQVKKAVNMDGPPWIKVGYYKVTKDEKGHPVKIVFNTRKDRLGERKVFKDGKSPAFDDAIRLVRWLEYEREKVKYPDTEIPSDLMKNYGAKIK
jgi:hypothetical protein